MKNQLNDSLGDFSAKESHLLWPALFDNAERHVKVAKILAEEKQYGAANAHLTMAAEEYIRAMNAYCVGWGVPADQMRELTRFFADAEGGYTVSPMVIVAGVYLRSLYQFFDAFVKDKLVFDILALPKLIDQHLNPIALMRKSASYSEWWAVAKKSKERGLYVTYDVELTSPADVQKSDYKLSRAIVKELKEDCLSTIELTQRIPEKQRKLFFKWVQKYLEPLLKRMEKLTKTVRSLTRRK